MTRREGLLAPVLAAPALLRPGTAFAQDRGDDRPLWPGARFTNGQRSHALERGMRFIHATASDPDNFAEFGYDCIWGFYATGAAAADPALKTLSWSLGRERAKQWRRENRTVPADADAADIATLVFGHLAADSLEGPDLAMKDAVRRAAQRFTARDFLRFDPAREPLPKSAPAVCHVCNSSGRRRGAVCAECKGERVSAYDLMCDALIATYTGEKYGVRVGASFFDVARLIPSLRPYRAFDEAASDAFIDTAYVITHVVYTLNDYLRYRLRPEWLPAEFEFLETHLPRVIEANDAETMGEFLDCLRTFGMTEADPPIQKGMDFVMSAQNPDGSWGDPKSNDAYHRYHATLTAVNGLMDCDWIGEGASFPEALRLARG